MVRPEKYGGTVSFQTYSELEESYVAGKLHPTDLKKAVASRLDAVVTPVREHFKGTKIFEEVSTIISQEGKAVAAQ